MSLPFWKMHGAGNDFILFDGVSGAVELSPAHIQRLCTRHTGIGSDGLIILRPSETADLEMAYWNPDGGVAGMCGNGARCAARLAVERGLCHGDFTLQTGSGVIGASADPVETPTISMGLPEAWRDVNGLEVLGETYAAVSLDTGVPHCVVGVESLDDLDVRSIGRAIRVHEAFAPEGTNATFAQFDAGVLHVRTYERGVEDETLACGTGVVAASLVHADQSGASSPITVRTRGGDTLHVAFEGVPREPTRVQLTGPATHVCSGEVAAALLR